MDLEHLTKHQILLLTLLVSFVTSIATGIVTVSLMDQAPNGVTRVINQIVERTVETVAPVSQGAAASSVTTVVVKDDDLAAQSIAKVQKSIIRITERGSDDLVARGLIIDGNGVAITDRAAIVATRASVLDAILPSGERVPAVVRRSQADGPIMVLDVVVGTSTAFAPAVLSATGNLKLGQSVIRIGGTGSDAVGIGVIARVPAEAGAPIETSVESLTPGAVLTTLFGEVVGMVTAASAAQGSTFYTVTSTEGML